MDIATDIVNMDGADTLSYDDVAYEAQLPTEAEIAARAASLATRIGTSKVYLLSESSAASNRPQVGKRKHDEENEEQDAMVDDEDIMDNNLSYRANAILLNGTPIAHLPTARIFAYATHFDARPMGLEWVNDTTCVLVFHSRKDAQEAYSSLQKSSSEEPDMDECISARPFPVALWPPEERINQTLGQGQGLKGAIRMRWARHEDTKKKKAAKESEFYRKHGSSAGKELFNGRDLPPSKRRRREDPQDDEARRAELDNELDRFLAEGDSDEEKRAQDGRDDETEDVPASPPSKMRSDYIGGDGRTLLERTSLLRLHTNGDEDYEDRPALASRITAPLPRRNRRGGRRDGNTDNGLDNLRDRLEPMTTEKLEWGRRDGRGGHSDDGEIRIFGASKDSGGDSDRSRRRRGGERGMDRQRDRERERRRAPPTGELPKKTQQELDDELDAFLRSS